MLYCVTLQGAFIITVITAKIYGGVLHIKEKRVDNTVCWGWVLFMKHLFVNEWNIFLSQALLVL